MEKRLIQLSITVFTLLFSLNCGLAQDYALGGRAGFSTFNSSLGLQIGPTFDFRIKKDLLIATEFNINTQGGTPVEWANTVKYLLPNSASDLQPYLDGGFGIWFVNGGPYYALRGGGGAWFKIAPDMYVPADVQLGPVFSTGSTAFYFAITSGIRYILPM